MKVTSSCWISNSVVLRKSSIRWLQETQSQFERDMKSALEVTDLSPKERERGQIQARPTIGGVLLSQLS